MSGFAAFLASLGLIPGVIAADGRWRRCPTQDKPRRKNGAYCLAPDGLIGWAQDWAIHDEPVTWRPETVAVIPPPDPARMRRQQERAAADRARATQGAREFYACSAPLVGGHEYLRAKNLDMTGCRGLKQDADGWLVVPMVRGRRELVSVQRIAPDGQKRFWPGAPTTGARYEIGRPGATLTVLCEGLATGLALFAAVPHSRVVVAFTAGNLARIARELPVRGMVAVAADNDHATAERIGRNPGVEAAREAARVLGVEPAIPEGMEGSDFCDLRQEAAERARAAGAAYGRRQASESEILRVVDGAIARAVLRTARLRRATG